MESICYCKVRLILCYSQRRLWDSTETWKQPSQRATGAAVPLKGILNSKVNKDKTHTSCLIWRHYRWIMINAQNRMCLSSKALIQLMAAAVSRRDMAYFTFGNKELAKEIQSMHEILTINKVTVGKYIHWTQNTQVLIGLIIEHNNRVTQTKIDSFSPIDF